MNGVVVSDLALAVVLGTAFGVGVCLAVAVVPRWGAPSLARRIGPYVREVTDARGIAAAGMVEFDVAAAWRAFVAQVSRRFAASASVAGRLRQAGRVGDAGGFRARQLAWALAAVLVAAAVAVALVLTGRGGPGVWLLPPIAGFAAVALVDLELSRAARARVRRVEEELPTVLEFLALCLSAGEGILDALRRAGASSRGELAGELRDVVLAVDTGSPLSDALGRIAYQLDVPVFTRTVDHLIAAIERGAPLVQVLQAQAQDAREDAKRVLIEGAGRKEIGMLLPLVFLILPLSVLFAVFPGVFLLRLGIG